jgi:4-amino-4-deoxy-L-arabinose transferase-like glycosyltransferase
VTLPRPNRTPWRSHAWFVAILALGIALRVAFPDLVRLTYDNAYPTYDALRLLDGHQLLTVGQPTSVFLNSPPLMAYLQALPLLVWRSPWAVVAWITALNTLALILIYLCARRLLGQGVALGATFLFAINPWVVFFSISTWLPALLPFFAALIACALWPVLALPPAPGHEHTRGGRLSVALLGLTAVTQTYLLAYGLLAQVGPLLLVFWRRIPRRALYVGLAVFALSMTIFAVGIARQGAADNAVKSQDFLAKGAFHFTREGIDHALRLVTGRDFVWVYTQDEPNWNLRRTLNLIVHYVLSAALLAGALHAVWEIARRRAQRGIAIVLLVWFGVPVLLMSVSRYPIHPYYLLLSCPAGHMLAAWGIAPLWRWKAGRVAVASLGVAFALFFGIVLYRAEQQVVATPTQPGFDGWSRTAASQVGTQLRELTAGLKLPRLVSTADSPVVLSAASGTWIEAVRDLDYPDFILLPGDEPLIYMLDRQFALTRALGPLRESFPHRSLSFADGTQISFLRVQPYSREMALSLPQVPVDLPSETGLTLLGYSYRTVVFPGEELPFVSYWRVDELRPERQGWYVAAFYHLVDGRGQMRANVSGHGRLATWWRQGDVYIERTRMLVPPDAQAGAYLIELGLFDRVNTRNYSLRSGETYKYSFNVPVWVED